MSRKLLWALQLLAAAFFLFVGAFKVFNASEARAKFHWAANGKPFEPYVEVIGALEIAAALGYVLPVLTGILPFLTPLAGVGTAIICTLALFINYPAGNYVGVGMDVFGILLSLAVVRGRAYLLKGTPIKTNSKKD